MAKFKVGDRVRISLLADNHSNAWLELNNETGKVTTVVEGFEVTSYRVQLDKPLVIDKEDYTFTQKNAIINETELLPIEDEDSVKILKVTWEIGDNCIYVDHDGSRHKAIIVDLEYRDEIEEIWYTVEYKDDNGNLARCGTIEDSLYNLPKFKVGNRVTILHEDYEGQEGIVGRVMENDGNPRYIVNIRYPEKVIMVCFGEDDLELSSNQDKSAAGPYIDYTEPKFKQGDLVVVRPPFYLARYWNRFGTVTNVIATATLKNMRNTYLIQFDNESLDADAEAFDECCLELVPRFPKYKVGDQVEICYGCIHRTITSIEYRSNEDVFEYHLEHTIDGKTYKEMLAEDKLRPIEDKVVIPKYNLGDLVRVVELRSTSTFKDAVGKVYDATVTIFGPESFLTTYKIDFGTEELNQHDASFSECDLRKLNTPPKFMPHDMVKFETQDDESECIGQVDKIICDVDDSGKEKFRYGVICRDSKVGYFYKFESELEPFLYNIKAISIPKDEVENLKVTVEEPKFEPSNYVDTEFMVDQSKDFHLFVSQPMSGLTMDEIFKARESAIDTFMNLYEQSCNIDPDLKLVVIDNIQEEFTKQCEAEGRTPHSLEYLGNDIKMMKDADAIVFAKGWENSKGCSVEFLVAKHNNIPMYFE